MPSQKKFPSFLNPAAQIDSQRFLREHVIGHTPDDPEEDISEDYFTSVVSLASAWGGAECPFADKEEADEFLFGNSPKHHIFSMIRFVKDSN